MSHTGPPKNLVHGEVNVAVYPLGTPVAGVIAEVFRLDDGGGDALDLAASRPLADASLDAVVDIMMDLRLP